MKKIIISTMLILGTVNAFCNTSWVCQWISYATQFKNGERYKWIIIPNGGSWMSINDFSGHPHDCPYSKQEELEQDIACFDTASWGFYTTGPLGQSSNIGFKVGIEFLWGPRAGQ